MATPAPNKPDALRLVIAPPNTMIFATREHQLISALHIIQQNANRGARVLSHWDYIEDRGNALLR